MAIACWYHVQGETALHVACRRGLVSLVRALLEAGANANIQTVLSADGSDGVTKQTPLHVAVEAGHKDIVRTFLDFKGTRVLYFVFLTTHEAALYIISVVFVCLFVFMYLCLSDDNS